jgi:tetratricopeptide (TPR) repeat protein
MTERTATGRPASGALSALIARLARAEATGAEEAWAIPLGPGERVGRYEILRELGRGGFGVIYAAVDHGLGREVAVKTVRPGRALAADGGAAWLRDEAEAVASLSHPGIVSVYDVGEIDGAPYVVMELLRGETLHERLQRGPPLSREEALRIAREVAEALVYAHARGVVHRDLKPENVFLCEDGRTKLLDFGLAHVFGHRARRSGGTPPYLAPERWRNEPEDARTDLFSLGVMLYELLSGKVPYHASDAYSAALDPGPPPPLDAPHVPKRLHALVASALSKAPQGRPASAAAFLAELEAVERRLQARRQRWPRIARSTALVLVAAAAALLLRSRPAPDAAPGAPIVVAVADFANETGDASLDGLSSLSGLVITSLEQSRRVQVLTRPRMVDILRRLGHGDAPRIDEDLARKIGMYAGAQAVLVGSVRRFDDTYVLELRGIDPARDAYLFAMTQQGVGKASIPGLIDRISAKAREALREGTTDIRSSIVKIADVVTPNVEAYQHYFVGADCLDRPSRYPDHPRGCLRELHEAVSLDPGFALAWLQIALAGWEELTPAAEDRGHAIAQALRHADRLPPRERIVVRAWAAHLDGKDDEALALFREVVEQYPDDKQALFLAGDLSWHRDDHGAVIPYMARVLELDPTNEFALDHLSYSLAVLGRREDLERWGHDWAQMAPVAPVLRALVRANLGLGDAPTALAAARRGLELGPEGYALPGLGWTLTFTGDYATLEAELEARGGRLSPLRYLLAHAIAAQGRRAEALRVLEAVEREDATDEVRRDVHIVRAMQLAGDGDPAPLRAEVRRLATLDAAKAGVFAAYLARLGDLEHARELASHLEPGSPYLELYLAVVDWKEGRPALARARLDALEVHDPLPRGAIAPSFLRAEVAADEGLDAEAVYALRRYQRLPFQASWRSWAYPRSLVLLASSLERLGKLDDARAELARFDRLWAHADPGLPLSGEARAVRARLERSVASAGTTKR